MLQISPFSLHANALFHLLGYLLRARWINTAPMHLPIDYSPSCDDPSSLVGALSLPPARSHIYHHHEALDKYHHTASHY